MCNELKKIYCVVAHSSNGDMFITKANNYDFRDVNGRWQRESLSGFWYRDEAEEVMETYSLVTEGKNVQLEIVPQWLDYYAGTEIIPHNDKGKFLNVTSKRLSEAISYRIQEGQKDINDINFRCQNNACSMELTKKGKLRCSVETIDGKEASEELEPNDSWFCITFHPSINYSVMADDAARAFMKLLQRVK